MVPSAPAYDGRCLTAVLAGCADSIGATASWCGGQARTARTLLGMGRHRRIGVVLVDGLGKRQLAERSGHARFLAGRPRASLDAAFPTTTAVSLTSLGTGRPPGTTAVAGYQLRDPSTGRMVSMIGWQGANPEGWQREQTVFEQLAAQSVAAIAVLPGKFAGSGLTRAALRGAETRAADGPDQLVDVAIAALAEPGPGLVYIYWGELDRIGHAAGWQSHEWGEELAAVDSFAEKLAAGCPAGAAIHLTSDHGMVDVAGAERWDVAQLPGLAAGVTAVGGEPRCLQLYTSQPADEVASRWRAELGQAAWVLTQREAADAGLFGEIGPRAGAVIGDVIVAMTGRATVVDSRTHSAAYRALKGQHGSLTPAEREVPFLRLA